jgi:hypothetical protein
MENRLNLSFSSSLVSQPLIALLLLPYDYSSELRRKHQR